MAKYSKTAEKLLPHLLQELSQVQPVIIAQAGGGGSLAVHALDGAYHSGTLAEAQAPWAVTATTFAAHEADPDAHHDQAHALVGGDHTASGLTAGHVVRANGATAFAFAQLGHGDLGGVTANQHHNQVHNVVGSDHTISASQFQIVGATGTNTLGLLTPSTAPGASAMILRTAADGSITLESVTVSQSFYAAATAFRVINHTHDYPHAHVVINPGVSWTLDEQFGVDIDDNLLVRGYIVGKHAIQLPGALLIAHYDGPEPYESNFVGEANGHMGQVATVAGGVVYRAGKFGKAAQMAGAITNLCSNPSFETNTTGWTHNDSNASGSMTRVSYFAHTGAYALQLYNANSNEDDYATFGLTGIAASTTYTVSAYVWVTAYSAAALSNRGLYVYDSANPGTTAQSTTITAGTSGWVRHTVAVTTTASPGTLTVRLYAPQAWTYWDAVQIEQTSYPTPYSDGSLGSGHTWSGTAHASSSSRTAATLTYGTTGNIKPLTGTIMAWVRVDALLASAQTVLRLDGTSAGNIFLRLYNNGRPEARWGTTTIAAASAIAANTWTHLAATYDSGTLRVYVDGIEVASGTSSSFSGLPSNMYVGASSGGERLNGLIDDLVILDRAASADEIRAVYESNAPVFAETSTWHWRSGRNRVYADAEGLWMLGASGSAVLGAYAGDDTNPSATKSWGGVTMSEGDVVIGHNQSGSAAMVWDRSAGKFQFVGNGSATVQAEIDTQGRVSAGAGKIVLGSNGARLALGSSRTTYLSTTDGARIMWSAAEIYETLEEEYTYLSTTYYRRSLVARTVTGFGANVSHTEIAALHETTSGSGVYRGPRIILESGAHIEDYTTTYSVDDLITMDADMIHITANRVRIEDDTATSYVEIYQGNSSGNVPPLTLSQSDLSEELIGFIGTVATGNPINTDALGSYYGRVRVSVNGTLKWMALYN